MGKAPAEKPKKHAYGWPERQELKNRKGEELQDQKSRKTEKDEKTAAGCGPGESASVRRLRQL